MITIDYLLKQVDRQVLESSVSMEAESGLTARVMHKPPPGSYFDINTPAARAVLREAGEVQVVSLNSSQTQVSVRDGRVEVTAFEQLGEGRVGEPVLIGANEGIRLFLAKMPGQIVKLLRPPALLDPVNKKVVVEMPLNFKWEPVPGAQNYHFVVPTDQAFRNVVADQVGVDAAAVGEQKLGAGTYFWRVSSIDREGLEGGFSHYRYVVVPLSDEQVPLIGAGTQTEE